ncbi:MAG TPA: hypothetical protein VGB01_02035, partial [candidate division Zixibacteria bacterium]
RSAGAFFRAQTLRWHTMEIQYCLKVKATAAVLASANGVPFRWHVKVKIIKKSYPFFTRGR